MAPSWGNANVTSLGGCGGLDMAWLTLLVAGLFEVGWAIGLKFTHGFTRLWPSVVTVLCMALSFMLLAHALKTLPIGTAYAVWTGIGTVGTALLGIILFAEPLEAVRLGCILLIVIGITGLRLLG
jgi:quaternary ammonium compound-resistance protein SugE